MAILCFTVYVVGFFLAGPALVLIAVATAQQGDFAISLASLVILAVVAKATAIAWRRIP